jgi:hypothetical protein
MIRITAAAAALTAALLALAAPAAAQPFYVGAREERRFGGPSGTLMIDAAGIAFRTEKAADARAWPYEAIRLLQIEAADRLVIETYDARGWLALKQGHRRVAYRLGGTGLPADALHFLLARMARPMVTRLLPAGLGNPALALPARHARRGDDPSGTLELYPEGLAFRGTDPADTRFWRFVDLASALRLDPFRLEIAAREADRLKPFTFELAEAVPGPFLDALWARLNVGAAHAGGRSSEPDRAPPPGSGS